MLYSLYEFYSKSSLDLYAIREHFLEHFYYQNHSRNKATNVLKTVINSSRIARVLNESARYNIMPTHEDFLFVICSMFKFMFSSNDTQILATMDAAIFWDIEINAKQRIAFPEDLRQNILKVFSKYQVYKEMSEKDFNNFPIPSGKQTLRTWSLVAFSDEFGKMKVEEYVNSDTGETFHSCVFTKGFTRTFVGFSSKLGELTEEEIGERKNELIVMKLPNNKYKLANKGKGY